MMRIQVHHRSIGVKVAKKEESKDQSHRRHAGIKKIGWNTISGSKRIGIVMQEDHVHFRTNGPSGVGITAMKAHIHHRTVGPRKAGITTLIDRNHRRTIGKIEDKDGKLQALKDRGVIAVTGKGAEERILV